MHPSFQYTDHRPWPLPSGDWKWRQSWLELLFIHYRIDAKKLRPRLPDGLKLQEYDGSAWLGLVPFRMAGVMRRPFPDIPPLSSFPEINLRTYVEAEGKPGVWFFSLDADCRPIVAGGRLFYDLPYFQADMRHEWQDGCVNFESTRKGGGALFAARYQPEGQARLAPAGTFEHWATERYCLYSHSSRRGLRQVEVHHAPWPLQQVRVEVTQNTMLEASGLEPNRESPIFHYSAGVQVVSFSGKTLSRPRLQSAALIPQAAPAASCLRGPNPLP